MSTAPPPGVYVPAVLFFDENEELDTQSIQAHILRLAKVRAISRLTMGTETEVDPQGGVTGILVQGSNGEAQHLFAPSSVISKNSWLSLNLLLQIP